MLMNGENCTDHTDYTDADERRELYGSHGKTRMLMNKDSVRSVESVQNKTAPRITRITRMQMNKISVVSVKSVQNKTAHGTHILDRRRANRKHTN